MKELQILDLLFKSNQNTKKVDDNKLQLSPIQVNAEYCKEWNENMKDFVVLTKNGELISNSLYRVGGLGGDITKDYFMLLKYIESVYTYEFIKSCYPKENRKELELRRKHLEGRWCILDKNGVEKKEFVEQFKYPYILKDSCIYSIDSNYYNIETDEFYGRAFKAMYSKNFLFLDCRDDTVMKINKKDGSFELFK